LHSIQAPEVILVSKETSNIEMEMKEQVMYDRYKDTSQETGKIGGAIVVKIITEEGIIVMKEKDKKIETTIKTEIGIGKEIPEKKEPG
jgi:hypothetical protein